MKYGSLVNVNFRHSYFFKESNNIVVFNPTKKCEKMLKQFSLMFRANLYGFNIIYPSSQTEDFLPVTSIDEKVVFDFIIASKDPYLMSYSDLPFIKPLKEIIHFSNAGKSSKNNSLSLSIAGKGSESGIKAKQMAMDTILSQDEVACDKKPFAIISLHVSDDVLKTYRFVDPKQIGNADKKYKVEPKTYQINVGARSTYWRYHVIPKYNTGIDLKKLKIKNDNNGSAQKIEKEIEFKISKGNIKTHFGDNRSVFISKKPILFREKGYKHLVLCNGDEDMPIIPHLPNPDVTQVVCEDGECYSDVIVYI